MKTLTVFIIMLFASTGFTQNLKSTEQDLLNQFKKIFHWYEYTGEDKNINKYDSLESVNLQFQQNLLSYTSSEPHTIDYGFYALKKEGLTITTSSDKLFRIYSWDTWTGGTMHFFDNIFQFKSGNKVFSFASRDSANLEDAGSWFSEIYTLKTTNKTYYLGLEHATLSTKDSYQAIEAFQISNDTLEEVKLFKTKGGVVGSISFEFNFFSVYKRKERPVKLIDYNPLTKILKIPVVLEDGTVTNKSITYRFTGKCFERKY